MVSSFENYSIRKWFCRFGSRYSSTIKMRHERRLPQNSVSIFQVENVSPRKLEKKWKISDTIQSIFVTFSTKYRTVSGHLILVTDDLGNVGQGQKLEKNNCWHANISKKYSQRCISLTVIGSQNSQRISEFGITTANNHRFKKLCSVFHLFHVEWKTKVLRITGITQHFQKCCTDYERYSGSTKNVGGDRALRYN